MDPLFEWFAHFLPWTFKIQKLCTSYRPYYVGVCSRAYMKATRSLTISININMFIALIETIAYKMKKNK